MPRPNVAPRPVCRYYNNNAKGCFAGDKCRYLHGDPAVQKYAPYEENKTCRFYAQGYCKRGNECWFKHIDVDSAVVAEVDASCGICFEERPALYGLLTGCSHSFCLNCIRQWRDPEGKGLDIKDSGIHKTCPMCRMGVKFVIPSSRFYLQGDPRKVAVIENYKQSMAKVPCRWFVCSKPGSRFCPFGKDCFYQHIDSDGMPYEFKDGVDEMMMGRRYGPYNDNSIMDPLQAALQVLEGFAETMASDNHGAGDSDEQRAMIDMHVTDLLRMMGHAPALRTLATLEQMAGEAEDDEVPDEQLEDRFNPPPPTSSPLNFPSLHDRADSSSDSLESFTPQSTNLQQCQPLPETSRRERDGQRHSTDIPQAIHATSNMEIHGSEGRVVEGAELNGVDGWGCQSPPADENEWDQCPRLHAQSASSLMDLRATGTRAQIVGEEDIGGTSREQTEDPPSIAVSLAPTLETLPQSDGEGEVRERTEEHEQVVDTPATTVSAPATLEHVVDEGNTRKQPCEQERVQDIPPSTPSFSWEEIAHDTRSPTSTPNRSSDLAGNGAVYYSPHCPWMIPERGPSRISNFAWMMPRMDTTSPGRFGHPIRDQEEAARDRAVRDVD